MGILNRISKNQLIAVLVCWTMLLSGVKGLCQTEVNWLTWEEAIEKSEAEKKKFFVDVYTKWCGWCKKMDQATFQKPEIAEYLNEHFYSVKFDAEQKEDILFKDKTHKYIKAGKRGYNTLAAELTKGRLSYPTIVFLDEDLNVIQPIPGFRGPNEFEMIMTYFAGDYFKTTPWKHYQKNYIPLKKKMNNYSQSVNYKNN